MLTNTLDLLRQLAEALLQHGLANRRMVSGSAILNLMPMTPHGRDRKKFHKQMPWAEWDTSLPRIVLGVGWTLPISRYFPQPVYKQVWPTVPWTSQKRAATLRQCFKYILNIFKLADSIPKDQNI